ncbi:nicotinate-nucleotide--dimethylbenzimidazole phosphoribosyltransferase [Odoribacter lunatus]|uniref:nicotinate-nucleotide--dimethylbenzimidazole phosphoribosyltransferase n=1 Tax=Odoribacter lunatus TaxID=2941335 RepID=UPI00203CF10A|nr:nicotinate-nucleotide--dimethylbenzimidazole phosphoribosyltransferase [Odoribacter lunatus]
MRAFHIQSPDGAIVPALVDKINNLTKPKGSLGRLEELAVQIGSIQQTLSPQLCCPQNIIFAADHGIVKEGVSFSAPEVTAQAIPNFLKGGAGVNMFCRQHHFKLKVVDCGVNFDFAGLEGLIDRKIRMGTRNYLYEAAMTEEEFDRAIAIGEEMVEEAHNEGTNVISFGEMGVTNTSSSSLWMTYLTGISLDRCVGAGSGWDDEGVRRKYDVLKRAMENYKGDASVKDVLRYFGGYEMVAAVGAMLRAAELKMVILIDGFIMTNCLLAAWKLYPEVKEYCIFGHQGDESGHKLVLDYLGAKALLQLDLRLGEGTGAICAYPIIDSAVRMINEMNDFKKAAVTKYFD